MLTENQYTDLWNLNPIGMGSFATIPGIAIPPYPNYVIRENMYQDYLDIFRGVNTRNIRQIPAGGWYYPHPFFEPNGITPILINIPRIKYVLIAEAPPQIDDEDINYIYNLRLAGGAYITAPLRAFDVNPNGMNTLNRLINLANQGVLFIDLFPFAIDYSNFRDRLNDQGITKDFFINQHNKYSIKKRIDDIERLFCDNFNLLDEVNSAFVAPPKTSHSLAKYAANNEIDFISLRIGSNIFDQQINNVELEDTLWINVDTLPNNLIGLYGKSYPLINDGGGVINRVPFYGCCCYNETRGENPRALFIKSALGL